MRVRIGDTEAGAALRRWMARYVPLLGVVVELWGLDDLVPL